MLDPRTIRALAARPAENGAELNVAIAEEGDAPALASLVRWVGLEPAALATIARRVLHGPAVELPDGDDPPKLEIPWEPSDEPRPHRPWTLARALLASVVTHPRAPAEALEAIVAAHPGEPGFLLAASLARDAPAAIVERVAAGRARSPLHDRPWIDLLTARFDAAAYARTWSTSPDELLRDAAGRLSEDQAVLDALAADPSRRVRRAVAFNPAAIAARARLAAGDPAIEVRGAASGLPHPRSATGAARALARATRILERGGDVDEHITDAILAAADRLDPELAWMAGLVLDLEALRPVALALAEHDASHPSSRALLAAAMVRPSDAASPGAEAAARSELFGLLARAIQRSYVPSSHDGKQLTGHARLVAFLAELLADRALVPEEALIEGLAHGALIGDPALAARWIPLRQARAAGATARIAAGLVASAALGGRPPACALEAAWGDPTLDVDALTRLARVTKPRRESSAHLRGRADGTKTAHVDLDLDPALRPPLELARVVEALDPWVKLAMRSVLVVLAAVPRALAVGGRDLRQWVAGVAHGEHLAAPAGDGVLASQLQRVLRAVRGHGADHRDTEARVAKVDVHADEAGLAVALLAGSARGADVARLLPHANRIHDGVFVAAIVEALWALGRKDDVRALVDVLGQRRQHDPAALAAWLLVGEIDRARTISVFAGALDAPIAATAQGPLGTVCQALGIVERRHPGTLERLRASTRTGQAVVVNALARAYPGLVGGR